MEACEVSREVVLGCGGPGEPWNVRAREQILVQLASHSQPSPFLYSILSGETSSPYLTPGSGSSRLPNGALLFGEQFIF